MGNSERRSLMRYIWVVSAFVLPLMIVVALIFNFFNRFWGFGGPLDEIWRILLLAAFAAGLYLYRRTKRTPRFVAIMIIVNIAIIVMPYGPGDVALSNLSGLMYWKAQGQNRYGVANTEAHWLRVVVANDYNAPAYIFTVTAEGELTVSVGHAVKEWNRLSSLYWPGELFTGMTEEVLVSGHLHLNELQQTSLANSVHSLVASRLRGSHSTHNWTTIYVEYAGGISAFEARDVANNEPVQRLLTELVRLSPVEMSLCDVIGDDALVYGGLCEQRR